MATAAATTPTIPLSDRSNDRSAHPTKRGRLPSFLSPSKIFSKKKALQRETPVSIRNAKTNDPISLGAKTPRKVDECSDKRSNPSTKNSEDIEKIGLSPFQSPNGRPTRQEMRGVSLFQNQEDYEESSTPALGLEATLLEKLKESQVQSDRSALSENPLVAFLHEENRRKAKGWLRMELFGSSLQAHAKEHEKAFLAKFSPLEKSTREMVLVELLHAWGCVRATMDNLLPSAPATDRHEMLRRRNMVVLAWCTSYPLEPFPCPLEIHQMFPLQKAASNPFLPQNPPCFSVAPAATNVGIGQQTLHLGVATLNHNNMMNQRRVFPDGSRIGMVGQMPLSQAVEALNLDGPFIPSSLMQSKETFAFGAFALNRSNAAAVTNVAAPLMHGDFTMNAGALPTTNCSSLMQFEETLAMGSFALNQTNAAARTNVAAPPTCGAFTMNAGAPPPTTTMNGTVSTNAGAPANGFVATAARAPPKNSQDVCSCEAAERREAGSRDRIMKCGHYGLRHQALQGSNHVVMYVPNNYVLVTKSEAAMNEKARTIVKAFGALFSSHTVKTTLYTRMLYAACAATFYKVPADTIQIISGIARYCMLKEIESELANVADGKFTSDFQSLYSLQAVLETSPKARSIETSYIKELATIQAFLFSYRIRTVPFPCLQEDKGPDGSEVQIISYFDKSDKTVTPRGSPKEFIVGLQRPGKSAENAAEAVDFNLTALGLAAGQFLIFCTTGDSGGGGDAQFFAERLMELNRFHLMGFGDSCGQHDCQSIFRLPVQQLIGDSGLFKRTPLQCLFLIYSVFQTFRELGNWKELVLSIFRDINGAGAVPDKDLLNFIQNPVILHWWTIGELACFALKYWDVLFRMAIATVNYAKKGEQHSKASELWSLMKTPGIKAGIAFVAGFSRSFLNKNMAWYGKVDSNVGAPGRLAFHRTARYFYQVRTVQGLIDGDWLTGQDFSEFCQEVELIENEMLKGYFQGIPVKFFKAALRQIHKHCGWYLVTTRLLRAAFGEPQLGKSVARLLLNQDLVRANETPGTITSPMQGTDIEILAWNGFLEHGTESCIDDLRQAPLVIAYRSYLEKIADDFDIWALNDIEAMQCSEKVLEQFGMNSQSNQACEHAVYLVTKLRASGKSESQATLYLLAGNNGLVKSFVSEDKFKKLFGGADDDDGGDDDGGDDDGGDDDGGDDDDDDDDDSVGGNGTMRTSKKKRLRGTKRAVYVEYSVSDLLEEYARVWQSDEMSLDGKNDLRKKVVDGLKKGESFHAKRQAEDMQKLLAATRKPPKINAIIAKTGIDLPARARDKFPLIGVVERHGHKPELIAELRFRHIPLYVPFSKDGKAITHPVPLSKEPVGGHHPKSGKQYSCFEEMTITQLKNLLMIDEERRFQMDDQDGIERSKFCGKCLLKYRVKDYDHGLEPAEKDIELDIDLSEKAIDGFDKKEFVILNEDVLFRSPEEALDAES